MSEILKNHKIQVSVDSFMRTVLYNFEELSAQNKILKDAMERLSLIFNREDGCYTNHHAIVVGTEFPGFKNKSDDMVYKTAQAIIVHEVAHVLYTNQKDWMSFINTSGRKYKKFSSAARSILNILEDYRIEDRISKNNVYYKKILLILRYGIIKDLVENLKEDAKEISNDQDRGNYLINSILVMGFTGSPFYIEGDTKTNQYIDRIHSLVEESRRADTTGDVADISHKIMEILQELDIETLELNELLSALIGRNNRSKGTGSPAGESDGDGNGDKESDEESDETEDKDEQKEDGEEIEKNDSYELGGADGGEQDPTGKVTDITENINNSNEKSQEDMTEELLSQAEKELKEEDNKSKNQITKSIIDDYLSGNDEVNSKMIEFQEKNLDDVINNMPGIHSKRVLNFKKNFRKFSTQNYDSVKSSLKLEINRAVRKLREVIEENDYDFEYEKTSGYIDTSQLASFAVLENNSVFKQDYAEENTLSMDVMLLIDCSGSTSSTVYNKKNKKNIPRFVLNQMLAVYLHEVLKTVEMNHSVWGFDSSTTENVAPMISFENCFKRDSGLYLGDISARSANRDGYHIRLAGDELNRATDSDKKLLIVLSDGQPASDGYYGEPAMKDVRDAIKELEKNDVKTIGIFSGHEEENKYFETMYDDAIFLNNDSLSDFPEELEKILMKEFIE